MKGNKRIIYWHRLGFKVYNVANSTATLEKELESSDIEQIKIALNYLKDETVFLLLSDSISYLYEKNLNPPLPLENDFKSKLLDLIKSEIPEDFSDFIWDYKVEQTLDNQQKIIIFAPIKEFQILIKQVSDNLNLKFNVIETESIASIRDPNPILGIAKKTDLQGKDEEVLNLSITPTIKKKKNIFKIIGIFFVFCFIGFTIFSIIKAIPKQKSKTINSTPIISQTPTETPIPTVKAWSELNLMVQNGTSKAGLASKTALIFKDNGIAQVETGNADNDSYVLNKLIFKDSSLKENHQNKFKELVKIKDENINIDNSIQYDVIFILGLN